MKLILSAPTPGGLLERALYKDTWIKNKWLTPETLILGQIHDMYERLHYQVADNTPGIISRAIDVGDKDKRSTQDSRQNHKQKKQKKKKNSFDVRKRLQELGDGQE